jgi:hypothetical membrane protein
MKDFILGRSPHKVYFKHLVAAISVMFLALLISIVLYEPTYYITENEISYLDSVNRNPVGLWYFKFAEFGGGLWFVPIAASMLRTARSFSPVLGTLAGTFYVISGVGLVLVGFFPTRVSKLMHVVGAGVGFGGILLGILFTFVILVVQLVRAFDPKVLSIMLLFHLPFLVVYVLSIVFVGIPLLFSLGAGIPYGDFQTPEIWFLLEWLMLLTAMYSTCGTYRILWHLSEQSTPTNAP